VRVLAALALAAVPALAAEEPRPDSPDAFAGIVEARLAESESPGCIAVGLVGEKTWMKFACTPGAGPLVLDEHSLFEIGSISKGFTGLLLADMVRKGEVSLDDPASKYARPGARIPTYQGRPISLRDLVTHTSGLPRMPAVFNPSNPRDPYASFTEDRLYEALASTETRHEEANYAKFEYSNFGFMWLSDLLARAGGKPYETLLRERILEPLALRETALILSAEQEKRFVQGHGGTYEPVAHWTFSSNLAGVGGLRSSLADMLRLGKAFAGREDTPLKETIALALKPLRPTGLFTWTGYAWLTIQPSGAGLYRHGGGTAGFRSMIAVNPATRMAAVVLVDSIASFDDLAVHLVDPGYPLIRKRVGLATDPDMLKQYAGRYELSPAFAIEVFVEGAKLMAQATAQNAFEVLREGPDVFFYTVVPARLRFSRGAGGEVQGMTLEQGGRELKGKRTASTR
jgi:D-alanyl-D-alanine-carboxypeptidase/D-alanyl-D-alanine-endopeptidase